jgi:iron complex outermembrane receptor protein
VYAQGEWRVHERVLVMAGVRHSRVQFDSTDYFIAAGNPDDSGAVSYAHTSPAVGVTFDASAQVKLYANIGRGFETPTFAELAYRTDGRPGLNFGLRPAVSSHREAGAKFLLGQNSKATLAVFSIDVSDEIVIASSAGGRTTFKNASHTRREGVEYGWQARLGKGWDAAVAYTRLYARFTDPFTSGTPAVTVRPGSRLPGVPETTIYGELVWRHTATGFHAGAEVRHNGRVFVDDANSDSAPPYTIANLRAGFEQRLRQVRLTEFVRVDNVANRRYIGSVIVAEANGRFYEPAPTRNWMAGVAARVSF